MRKASSCKISIYLRIDANSITHYFNPHDPARLDKRHLGQEFKDYLDTTMSVAGRHTEIEFKVFCCENGTMRFMVEPLIKTIRRHYNVLQKVKEHEFYKFKRKNFILLCASILVVMFCHGILPFMFGQDDRIHSMFSNAIDVFSWVVLWKPIDRLIFYWNPFLKEILLYKNIQKAKVKIVENEEDLINYHMEHFDAA